MFKSRADSNIVYKCTVRLLEDTEILECEFHVSSFRCLLFAFMLYDFAVSHRFVLYFQPSQKGKYLLDYVCQQLNLIETDYFGLRFVDGINQRVSFRVNT